MLPDGWDYVGHTEGTLGIHQSPDQLDPLVPTGVYGDDWWSVLPTQHMAELINRNALTNGGVVFPLQAYFDAWKYWTLPEYLSLHLSDNYAFGPTAAITVHSWQQSDDFRICNLDCWSDYYVRPAHLQWLWVGVTLFPAFDTTCWPDLCGDWYSSCPQPDISLPAWATFDIEVWLGDVKLIGDYARRLTADVVVRPGYAPILGYPVTIPDSTEVGAYAVRVRQEYPDRALLIRVKQSEIANPAYPFYLPISFRLLAAVADIGSLDEKAAPG
jgi:hypothetical protein